MPPPAAPGTAISPPHSSSSLRQFGVYALDADNACLWHRDTSIPLTPRVFAVLSYLVDRAGRLVTTAELLQSVWPDTHVQPQVLRTYILEIRKLLGDRASQPVFIQTLPKRGYRFLPPVSGGAADASLEDGPQEICLGRTNELAWLAQIFQRVLLGRRQVTFVTGETGIGKTAVVDAFAARQAATHAGIRIARGQCVEGYGGVEPYYVLLEAMSELCAGSGGRPTLDLLDTRAPSWRRHLARPARAGAAIAHRVGASGEPMVRELCDVLDAISAERPLILILEDLQWVDRGTLDVLSAIARRRQSARLMVLATYRPADVAHTGSPLQGLKHDLVLHRLGDELALQPLDAAWIRRRLELELGSSVISSSVTSFVQRFSEGNPLFADAIIQHLRNCGLVCLQHGSWTQRCPLDGHLGLPATLEQLFALQVSQLAAGDQQILEAASVAGPAFSARSLADAMGQGLELVEERLQHLAGTLQFITRVSEVRDPSRPHAYAFVHALYREALLRRLPPTRRSRLLARIAAGREAAPRVVTSLSSI